MGFANFDQVARDGPDHIIVAEGWDRSRSGQPGRRAAAGFQVVNLDTAVAEMNPEPRQVVSRAPSSARPTNAWMGAGVRGSRTSRSGALFIGRSSQRGH
jgi:hypothetical protein